jgi:hypothetical protein
MNDRSMRMRRSREETAVNVGARREPKACRGLLRNPLDQHLPLLGFDGGRAWCRTFVPLASDSTPLPGVNRGTLMPPRIAPTHAPIALNQSDVLALSKA